jgi:hypothetical protein
MLAGFGETPHRVANAASPQILSVFVAGGQQELPGQFATHPDMATSSGLRARRAP